MSLTSMLINRQVPTFPAGLPTFINRPDANRRPIIVADIALKTASGRLMKGRNLAAEASVAQSRHAILDAIKAGANTKKAIQEKSRLSKSSVFNHIKSMVADGILSLDKDFSPAIVRIIR